MRSPIDRKLRPRWLVLFLALTLALQVPSASQADSLAHKSGSQLSGKVTGLNHGTVVILGNDGKMTTVKWRDVRRLKINEPVLVTLDTGKTLAGRLTVQKGFVYLTSPSLGTVSLAQQRIVKITRTKKEVLPVAGASAQTQEMGSVRDRGTGEALSEEKPAKPKKSKAREGKEEKQPGPLEKKVDTFEKKEENLPENTFLRREKVSTGENYPQFPWTTWGELSQPFVTGIDNPGLKLDGYLEQSVDWLRIGGLRGPIINTFLGLRFVASTKSSYWWDNKAGPWFGLKLKFPFRPFMEASGELALSIRGEYYTYYGTHSLSNPSAPVNNEFQGIVAAQWSANGKW